MVDRPDPIACPECRAYYLANRGPLLKVCAQVGAEHGVCAGPLLQDYLVGFHQAGHREDRI